MNIPGSFQRLRRAFTLVEMVVVVSIILVILVLIVPAAATLWEERKKADAFNTMKGMIKTSRALALKSEGRDRGFLAYVDNEGVQRLISIEQAQVPFVANPVEQSNLRAAYENIFDVTPDRIVAMPAPLRAVPRYAVEASGASDTPFEFSEEELDNNDFANPPLASSHKAQRHRNFFTMVFSSSGEVLVGRDVIIRDLDEDDDGIGDLSDLAVGSGDPVNLADAGAADVGLYWFRDSLSGTESQFDIHPLSLSIPFLVVDPEDPTTAFNFYSVDGVLLYDDDVFGQISDRTEKREWLLTSAQPMYLNRWTGNIIRGPIGEVQTQ